MGTDAVSESNRVHSNCRAKRRKTSEAKLVAVVHLEKAKGTDSGMSAHIERTIAPHNAKDKNINIDIETECFIFK